jgi:hypothetical protein
LLWSQAIEFLQAFPQLCLPLRRELLEVRIILQEFLLLVRREALMIAEPFSHFSVGLSRGWPDGIVGVLLWIVLGLKVGSRNLPRAGSDLPDGR